jgi:hypothetical protein
VLAVLGAGDDRQAGVHSADWRDVIGDRVAEFAVAVSGVQEVPVRPPALAGARVGVQRPADKQAVWGEFALLIVRKKVSGGPAPSATVSWLMS